MLAVYQSMSSSQAQSHSHSFQATMPPLLRQPSAEDIDAAHQLVSSARGERNYNSDTPKPSSRTSQPPTLSPQPQPQSQSQTQSDFQSQLQPQPPNSEPEQVSNSTAEDTRLGQVCSNCGTTRTPLWRRSPQGNVICNACGLYQKTRNAPRPVNVNKKSATPAKPKSPRLKPVDAPADPSLKQISVPYRVPEHIPGSCPGGGQCNGAGGAVGCGGCPAFNNRMTRIAPAKPSHDDDVSVSDHGSPVSISEEPRSTPASMVVACKNCHTTVTPLWRRDEAGHPICNACGLYHKLHGSHRPVQMKKATIKRRKRVVPAAGESEGPAQSNASHTSLSPDPPEFDENASKRIRLPPIVDFTGYRPDGVRTSEPSAYRDGGSTVRSPGTPYTSLPPLQHDLAPPTIQELERRRNDRRQHLMREAEEMRAALRAKEREIDELER